MSMKYIVLEQGTLVIERWFGDISHETFIEHEKKQLQDDSIKPGTICLADARESNFLTAMDRIPELFALYSQQEYQSRYKKIAILVSDESFEKAKIFEKFAQESLDVSVIVFSNVDVACRWLGIDFNQALRHISHLTEKSYQPES